MKHGHESKTIVVRHSSIDNESYDDTISDSLQWQSYRCWVIRLFIRSRKPGLGLRTRCSVKLANLE